jgi:phage tail sheath protein FI
MPESHSPDIFIQEIPGGTSPIEGVDTSTAGFLGIAERGPALPTLLTSFREYREIFGNYVREGMNDRYLAYAVEGFFQNGGRRCYVQRVIGTHATAAGTTIAAAFTISALSPGLWGNGIAIEITWASPDPLFKLTVSY